MFDKEGVPRAGSGGQKNQMRKFRINNAFHPKRRGDNQKAVHVESGSASHSTVVKEEMGWESIQVDQDVVMQGTATFMTSSDLSSKARSETNTSVISRQSLSTRSPDDVFMFSSRPGTVRQTSLKFYNNQVIRVVEDLVPKKPKKMKKASSLRMGQNKSKSQKRNAAGAVRTLSLPSLRADLAIGTSKTNSGNDTTTSTTTTGSTSTTTTTTNTNNNNNNDKRSTSLTNIETGACQRTPAKCIHHKETKAILEPARPPKQNSLRKTTSFQAIQETVVPPKPAKSLSTGSLNVSSSPNKSLKVHLDETKPASLRCKTQATKSILKTSPKSIVKDDTSITLPAVDETSTSSFDPIYPVSAFRTEQRYQRSGSNPSRHSLSDRTLSASSVFSNASSVSFGTVSIHSHQVILGDNPSVRSGPPLTLDWKPFDTKTVDLDSYERYFEEEGRRRTYAELRIPQGQREQLLKELDYNKRMLRQVLREIDFIRRTSSFSEVASIGVSSDSGSSRTTAYEAPFFIRILRPLGQRRQKQQEKHHQNHVEEDEVPTSVISYQIDR